MMQNAKRFLLILVTAKVAPGACLSRAGPCPSADNGTMFLSLRFNIHVHPVILFLFVRASAPMTWNNLLLLLLILWTLLMRHSCSRTMWHSACGGQSMTLSVIECV